MLVKDCSKLMDRWNYDRNSDLNSELDWLTSGSSRKAWFICENAHDYERPISDESKKGVCKYCKSIAFNFPEIVDMFTDNNNRTAWEYPTGSDETIELRCAKHGIFTRVVKQISKSKKNGGDICIDCNKDKRANSRYDDIPKVNNLLEHYPELEKLWSDKNKKGIQNFQFGSDFKAWWKCLDSEHHPDYKQSIYQKSRMKTGCPYCSGRSLVKEDSFGYMYPEYIKLWSDKNKKTPYDFTCYTSAKVWFKCENGIHDDYHSTISNKSHGKLCYPCGQERVRLSALRPKKIEDTIGFRRPELVEFWSEKNETSIYDHNYGTDKILWWRCESGVHEDYQQKSSNKVFKSYKCPNCKSSKGEILVEELLNELDVRYEKEFTLPNLLSANNGLLRVDFYLPQLNLYIEYDGIQHFKPVGYFGGLEGYQLQVENDRLKNEYCEKNGLSLLRIPYYMNEDDARNKIRGHVAHLMTVV